MADHEPDSTEKGLRFGCGALMGVVIGVGESLRYFPTEAYGFIGVVILTAIVCGLLAVRRGNRFWHGLADSVRGWGDWW